MSNEEPTRPLHTGHLKRDDAITVRAWRKSLNSSLQGALNDGSVLYHSATRLTDTLNHLLSMQSTARMMGHDADAKDIRVSMLVTQPAGSDQQVDTMSLRDAVQRLNHDWIHQGTAPFRTEAELAGMSSQEDMLDTMINEFEQYPELSAEADALRKAQGDLQSRMRELYPDGKFSFDSSNH